MAEKENITNPSMGSNELGEEIRDEVKGMPAGTDTQTKLAALSTDNSDSEKERRNTIRDQANDLDLEHDFVDDDLEDDESEFLEADETDE
jgi:hypothetical protein